MTPTYSNNQIPSNPGFRGNKSLNIHWQVAGYFDLYLHEIDPKYNSDQQHDHNFRSCFSTNFLQSANWCGILSG